MRFPWIVVGVLILALAAGVVLLDRRQTRRGEPSLLALPWRPAAPAAPRPTPTPRARPGDEARVALIVDELGSRADVFERVLALGRPVTVAVLPELPLSRRLARDAARAGLEVLLQLPLEPYRFPEVDPGPGVLLISMPPDEVTRRTRQHLAALPGAAGVVTRMGSRFTEDRARMRALLEPLFFQRLLFVDSLTSQASVGYDVARALGIPAGRRQVFVDPDESEASARAGLLEVERWATRRGSVIAIAHGRLLTVGLLAEAVPRWEAARLRLVPVSELVTSDRT
ncbi:MAG: divergent polysaccharide deacetylase family protein [Candidatus Rokubacteria bacterium]|nr:divergent polysaccharide deacetylase family protein [Candidatus Rokubacteria bacterium]